MMSLWDGIVGDREPRKIARLGFLLRRVMIVGIHP